MANWINLYHETLRYNGRLPLAIQESEAGQSVFETIGAHKTDNASIG
jgi:hypothetical protein